MPATASFDLSRQILRGLATAQSYIPAPLFLARRLPAIWIGLRRSALMEVREGMSSVILTLGPGHTLREAARRMTEKGVGAAVVIDEEQPGPRRGLRA